MGVSVSSGDEHDKKVCEIGHDAYEEANVAVKKALIRVHRETDSKNGADAVRASFYGGLGALVPCALIIGKRRELPDYLKAPKSPAEVTQSHSEWMYQNLKPETLTFAALLLAQMLEKITSETTSIGFGPIQIREALEQWKKLFPLAKPEDWLDEAIVKCVTEIEETANVAVDELMAKLKKASPGSSTFH